MTKKIFGKLVARFNPPRKTDLPETIARIVFTHFFDLKENRASGVVIAHLFDNKQIALHHYLLQECSPIDADPKHPLDTETKNLGLKILKKFYEFGFNPKDIPGEFYRQAQYVKNILISKD